MASGEGKETTCHVTCTITHLRWFCAFLQAVQRHVVRDGFQAEIACELKWKTARKNEAIADIHFDGVRQSLHHQPELARKYRVALDALVFWKGNSQIVRDGEPTTGKASRLKQGKHF